MCAEGYRAGGANQLDAKHRIFIKQLEHRKRLERQAATRRAQLDAAGTELKQREQGFRAYLNGANREVGPGRPKSAAPVASRSGQGDSNAQQSRSLRTARRLQQPQPQPQPRLPRAAQQAEEPRRARRQWVMGTVRLKAEEGDVVSRPPPATPVRTHEAFR